MQCGSISSEITGWGYRYPNVPAQMQERSASSVRYKTEDEQTGNDGSKTPCGAIRQVRKQESADVIVAKCRE